MHGWNFTVFKSKKFNYFIVDGWRNLPKSKKIEHDVISKEDIEFKKDLDNITDTEIRTKLKTKMDEYLNEICNYYCNL